MEISSASFVYNGQQQRPAVTLTYAGVTLQEGVDYEVQTYLASADVLRTEGGVPVKFLDAPVDSINAESYYVYAKGIGAFTSANAVLFDIDPAPLTVTANDHTVTYGDAPANNGVTYTGLVNGETEAVLGGTLAYACSYEQFGDVGGYEITPSGLTSENYDITFQKGTLTVAQKELGISWGSTEFIYNGAAQKPTAAATGMVNGDQISFTVGGEQTDASADAYTATVTGIDGAKAGNYKLPALVTTPFTIGKATPDLGTVSVSGQVKDTTKPGDVVLTQTGSVPGSLAITDPAMLTSQSTYGYVFTPSDTVNYNGVTGQVQIDVLDTIAPAVTVKIDANEWKTEAGAAFGLFYQGSQEVTIAYADNENGSGLKETLYFVSDKALTADELSSVQWQSYTGAFSIDPEGKFVVYAKASDNHGNSITVNSDGVVLDKTAAVIEGITNGESCWGDTTITATDALAGIAKVEVDGAEVTLDEGKYTIAADNAEHRVVVTDKAGNVTEYKVTVYKNYTVTYQADDATVDTQTVGYGKDAAVPQVPKKDGYVGKWDGAAENITADTAIRAVYTEVKNVIPDELKTDDKTGLEDTKKQLEEMLDEDGYTEADKKDIQAAIDDIDGTLKAIEKSKAVEDKISALPESITEKDEAAIQAAEEALDALSDYEKSLVNETVKKTLADAKEALADAKKALEDEKAALEEQNKPAGSTPPNTGDDSLWLCAVLMFISGACLFGLMQTEWKRRMANVKKR